MARGGFALAWGWTWIICTNIRPYALPKITSPLPSGVWQSAGKYDLRTSGGRVRGRPAERSGGGCQKRVWPAVSAPWMPDTGMGRLPRKRVTNFSTGFPRALRLKGVRAAPSGGGWRRVHSDPATGATPSGPVLTRLRCQRPAGKRHNVVDGERPRALLVQLAHQLPRPSTASGAASAASLALIGSVTAAEAATCLHRCFLAGVMSAAYGTFTSHG